MPRRLAAASAFSLFRSWQLYPNCTDCDPNRCLNGATMRSNFYSNLALLARLMTTAANTKLREAALDYHEFPTPGKIAIAPTKQMINQRDLALAYSPGVAFACEAIVEDPLNAARFTARSNLVGVVTNGTAVLGLGNIGPLASKPVMEGKAVLFKKFAGIDVFDIELNEMRSAQAGRCDRRARTDLRRHQSGRHQGAGLLHRRARMPQAHEDSGLPRRPARHGDRRRGGGHQWSEGGRQEHRRGEARRVGRGRGGARLSGSAGRSRPEAREHLRDGSGRRGLQGPRRTDGPGQGALRARNRRAHARRSDRRRGRVPRSVGGRRAQAGHGQAAWPRSR